MKRKIVYAYVVADLLHIGHIKYLNTASKYGDLVVGVLTDEATMEKKSKPIIPFKERMCLVDALKFVESIMPQITYSPLENVEKLKPDILIESTSHKEQPANKFIKSYGGTVVVLPYYENQSTTKIKEKISAELISIINIKLKKIINRR
jgi:cytidyltransferase-like protein